MKVETVLQAYPDIMRMTLLAKEMLKKATRKSKKGKDAAPATNAAKEAIDKTLADLRIIIECDMTV